MYLKHNLAFMLVGLILLSPLSNASGAPVKPTPKVTNTQKVPKAKTFWLELKFTWDGALKTWELDGNDYMEVDILKDPTMYLTKKCRNLNKYLDFGPGLRVVIFDEKSIVLDSDGLVWDDPFKDSKWMKFSQRDEDIETCFLTQNFKLPIKKFYSIKIGDENPMTYSYAQLKSKNFELVLSKG